jgi:glucose-6-phosphate 1-dehydrogenase
MHGPSGPNCDAPVIFGIADDLARAMTVRALDRLEQRALLSYPIVGVAVDDVTPDELVHRACEAIVRTGEVLDGGVCDRFVSRRSHHPGDFDPDGIVPDRWPT